MRLSHALAIVMLGACAAPRPAPRTAPPPTLAPRVELEAPASGALVREPEVDVRGRFETYDGRAWIWVEGVQAEVKARSFVARRVPLREGKMDVQVTLTDGQGRTVRAILPLVVETPDRPRSTSLCRPGVGCLRWERRGVPRRDATGKIVNAVVVLSAFGFDEKLDMLWPELVGPGRPLDSRRHYVVGVAGVPDDARKLPDAAAALALLDELYVVEAIDRAAPLIGASSYGAELALRRLAAGGSTGAVLVCGGHDRPHEEPAMRRVREALARAAGDARQVWQAVARVMVPASYTPRYLADAGNAVEHGLVEEARARGLTAALVERQAEHFARLLPPAELARRMDGAFALERAPLAYPPLEGRRVVLVANRDDQLISIARMDALRVRLAAKGASVAMHELSDPLGHSVFFRRAHPELERAVTALLAP